MRLLARGRAAQNPPGPAPGPRKVRWSDVEAAAGAALAEIEATWTEGHLDPRAQTWCFRLVTVEAQLNAGVVVQSHSAEPVSRGVRGHAGHDHVAVGPDAAPDRRARREV